jgi:hypothetical protein
LVSKVDGLEITHRLHRQVEVVAFLATLPSGSLDHVSLKNAQPYLVALVEVVSQRPESAPGKQTPRAFETTFHTPDGPLHEKWQPAEGNQSGKWSAVFTVPVSVTKAETRPVEGP